VSLLEQLALAGLSFGRAWSASRRPATWLPWLPYLGVSLLVLAALSWCAHPMLSWFMAPLLRTIAGEEALRYPGLYQWLPRLVAEVRFVLDAVLLPAAFGGSVLAFAAHFRGEEPDAGAHLRETCRLAAVFVLVALPAWFAEAGVHAGLAALPGIRLASVTRALAPHAGNVVILLARAAFLYVIVHAALVQRGPVAALAAWPGSLRDGFVPALLTLVGLAVPLAVLDAAVAGPLGTFGDRMPEAAVAFAAIRAGLATVAGVLAAGTATLVWLAALAPREDA
jgi:hypothetical protein